MLLIGRVSVCPAVLVSCIFASSLLVCHFDNDDIDGDEEDENNDEGIDDQYDVIKCDDLPVFLFVRPT